MTTPSFPDTLPQKLNNLSLESWVPLLRETLERDGKFFWLVQGQSMLPTLPPGSTIEIHPVRQDETLGDILVFAERSTLVVHRLVARHHNRWILQGDNRTEWDPPVQPAQVIGRVLKATYQGSLTYPHKFDRMIAYFWIARYHGLKLLRFVRRIFVSRF